MISWRRGQAKGAAIRSNFCCLFKQSAMKKLVAGMIPCQKNTKPGIFDISSWSALQYPLT
jgi:hypothetical protein